MSSTKHIGHQVIAMMDRMGVSPITRNYHLFYICIANSDPLIRRAVRDLGRYPSQDQLDQVIDKHCPEAADSFMMRRRENAVLSAIDDLADRLQSEQSQLSGFNHAIESVSSALAKSLEQDKLTSELLVKVVDAIGQAGNRRVAAGQRTLQRMRENKTEVDTLRDELIKVRRMANTDVLTGLSNRRHFDDRLASSIGKSQDFVLLLADIDHFKKINDAYGHAFGDHVLKCVAATLAKSSRAGTFIARTGGEEFAIVIGKSSESEATAIAERLRQAVEGLKFAAAQEVLGVTISVGVAMAKHAVTADILYQAADFALYRSKNAGRNRVSLHDPAADGDTSQRYRLYGS
jgi:diguanylate cyclase